MQHASVHLPDIDATCVKLHKELLLKIANSLGLTAKQSIDTLNAVYSELDRERPNNLNKTFSSKVYLSKLMVAKCIFRISNDLFSRADYTDATILNEGVCHNCLDLTSVKLKKVPLSYRVTFVLNALSEFSEEEIAEVLNISPIKVKERIKKAHSFMM